MRQAMLAFSRGSLVYAVLAAVLVVMGLLDRNHELAFWALSQCILVAAGARVVLRGWVWWTVVLLALWTLPLVPLVIAGKILAAVWVAVCWYALRTAAWMRRALARHPDLADSVAGRWFPAVRR